MRAVPCPSHVGYRSILTAYTRSSQSERRVPPVPIRRHERCFYDQRRILGTQPNTHATTEHREKGCISRMQYSNLTYLSLNIAPFWFGGPRHGLFIEQTATLQPYSAKIVWQAIFKHQQETSQNGLWALVHQCPCGFTSFMCCASDNYAHNCTLSTMPVEW